MTLKSCKNLLNLPKIVAFNNYPFIWQVKIKSLTEIKVKIGYLKGQQEFLLWKINIDPHEPQHDFQIHKKLIKSHCLSISRFISTVSYLTSFSLLCVGKEEVLWNSFLGKKLPWWSLPNSTWLLLLGEPIVESLWRYVFSY